jgi:predicted transcriptional regulator
MFSHKDGYEVFSKMCDGDIASKIHFKAEMQIVTVHEWLKKYEAMGLINIDRKNHRRHPIRLTEKGKKVQELLWRLFEA